ncbi:MAG TPA: PA domain-containing protein [Actinomycetota bacterium]|nr:PA domain-containing protein [Actinomycetota bacterium]
MRKVSVLVAVLSAVALLAPGAVAADPDEPAASGEMFPGEGVAPEDAHQHGENTGHLPAVSRGVKLIGKGEVSVQGGTTAPRGRVADVSAFGNYAYLTAFRTDNCLGGGAWVMDISDPANPTEVGFLPTTDGNYAGEGSQVINVAAGPYAGRQLFLHQNETCSAALAAAQKPAPNTGGINIWDVTDPTNATLLVEHAGDMTPNRVNPNTVHSVFAWNDKEDGKTYAALVDNAELADVDIMDITDPTAPVLVNDTLDLVAQFGVNQSSPSNLTSIFNHDMVVKRVGERYVMNVNYWDGGYVLLDVTDPTAGNVSLIAESDYAALDEERLARGHEISPEGNAHQSEISPDNRFLIGTDEDFNAFRVVAKITSGPYDGTEFTAISASGTPPIDEDTSISGTPTFLGEACGAVPAGDGVALIERGTCSFQQKFDNMKAAGYDAGIVFNAVRPDCMSLVRMLASGDLPFVFVNRLVGLQLLQVPGVNAGNACTTLTPGPGSPVASTSIEAIFDGWGYVRLFKTQIPGDVGTTGSMTQIDTYAIPESQDAAFAGGFGDLSVHEVAIDPNPGKRLAYFSYYSGGFRVARYGNGGLEEVGAFIDDGGNNFWGVEVHKIGKQQYVLASDRDFGLYIFQPTV